MIMLKPVIDDEFEEWLATAKSGPKGKPIAKSELKNKPIDKPATTRSTKPTAKSVNRSRSIFM